MGLTNNYFGCCRYGNCYQVSYAAKCYFDYDYGRLTDDDITTLCTRYNGTLDGIGTWYGATCNLNSTFSASSSSCYAPFSESCYYYTDYYTGETKQYCSSICYNSTVTDYDSCYAAGAAANVYSYLNSDGHCVLSTDSVSTCEAQPGFSFLPSIKYLAAYKNSLASCQTSVCNFDGQSTNATLCSTKGWCSEYCPACAFSSGADGACVDPTILTASACSDKSGTWNGWVFDSVDSTNTTACLLAPTSRAECSQTNGTWVEKSSAKTESACKSDSMYPLATQSYWSYWETCSSQAACESQGGSCNDYSYYGSGSGVCLTSSLSYYSCNSTDDYYFYESDQCQSTTLLTKKDCLNATGYSWVSQAGTEASCLAKNAYCITHDGSWITTDPTSCAACGGTSFPRYTWSTGTWTPAEMSGDTW